jgi:hypothetical protein
MMDDEERIQHAASDGFYAILDTLGIDLNFSQIMDESFPSVFDAVVALAAKLAAPTLPLSRKAGKLVVAPAGARFTQPPIPSIG